MEKKVLTELMPQVLTVVNDAAEVILSHYGQNVAVQTKQDNSPVTVADVESSALISERLTDLFEFPILSEESIPEAGEWTQWETFWLLDPLDGTRDFIHQTDDFTVNLALIHRGQPVLGVVHQPVVGVAYTGIHGVGAAKIEKNRSPKPVKVKEVSESPASILASRFHLSSRVQHFCETLAIGEIVQRGSALKFGLLAEGAAELYPRLGPTSQWDTAAGQAVVEAAGGVVLDLLSLEPLRYGKEPLLNPDFVAGGKGFSDWANKNKELWKSAVKGPQ